MKMPNAPLGLSRPPTIVNPSDFLPGPFSKVTVWKVHSELFGLRGSVQKLVMLLSISREPVPLLVSASSEAPLSSIFSSSQRFMVLFVTWSPLNIGDCFPTRDLLMSLVEFVAPELLAAFFVKDLRFTQSSEGGWESTSMLGMSQGGDGD